MKPLLAATRSLGNSSIGIVHIRAIAAKLQNAAILNAIRDILSVGVLTAMIVAGTVIRAVTIKSGVRQLFIKRSDSVPTRIAPKEALI
jgi:cellobiose-specific phosphotransferase system component IIC